MDYDLMKGLEKQYKEGKVTYEGESITKGFRFDTPLPVEYLLFTIARYKFALKFLSKEHNVLEAACGNGVGLKFISPHCKKLTGLDLDPEAARHCKEVWGEYANVKVGNVLSMPFSNNEFDRVVSLDTIEHVKAHEGSTFLKEICRVLNNDGLAIIATPRKSELASYNRRLAHAEGHEYEYEEFETLLKDHFKHVFVFSQNDEFVGTQNPKLAWHFIALCIKG